MSRFTLTIIHKFPRIFYSILTLTLLYSVLRSGYYYLYNIDELSHIQGVWLLSHGTTPYAGFFFTFTPFFYWFLMPLFSVFGFSLESIAMARMVMIILFLIRIAIEAQIVRRIFGRLTAFIFIPVFLLDTFTVMTAMQVRQDNLMMPLFSLGLLIFILGMEKKRNFLFFISGLIFSLSSLTLLKIAPSIVIILIFFFVYSLTKKRVRQFLYLLAGLIVPAVIFLTYIYFQGLLPEFIRQVIFDRIAFNASILWPTNIWYFYKPDNPMLFGFPGKPLTFIYIYLLPLMALLGVFSGRLNFLKVLLTALMIIQIILILSIKGVFLQYFITLSSLLAIFASVFLTQAFNMLKKAKSALPRYFFASVVLIFIINTFRANINRSAYNNKDTEEQIKTIWRIIPEGEKSFPNYLFRPLSYPLAMGAYIGDVPKSVLSRLGPISNYLEKDKVKYLLLNDYDMQFVPLEAKNYIRENYSFDPGLAIWRRSHK